MKKSYTIVIAIIFILFGGIFGLKLTGFSILESKNHDKLAKCLTENGVKMYGAYWCSHCQNQKKIFGSSFKYINYIECASRQNSGEQTLICIKEKIDSYPTWELESGSRVTGEQTLETLAKLSSCEIFLNE